MKNEVENSNELKISKRTDIKCKLIDLKNSMNIIFGESEDWSDRLDKYKRIKVIVDEIDDKTWLKLCSSGAMWLNPIYSTDPNVDDSYDASAYHWKSVDFKFERQYSCKEYAYYHIEREIEHYEDCVSGFEIELKRTAEEIKSLEDELKQL